MLLLFAGATGGCKSSRAAQQQQSYRPPPDGDIPPEPRMTHEEAQMRNALLKKLKEPLQLVDPDRAEASLREARDALTDTFGRWLPEGLRKRIEVTQPICLFSKTACYVDVSYLDWKTYVEVNHAIIEAQPPSPFQAFPGTRYRTGRVETECKGKKFMATWVLALQLRPPRDSHGHTQEGGW